MESGKISHREYDQAVAQATKELWAGYKRAAEVAQQNPDRRTWTLGSWKWTELYRSPDGQLQIGELQARDGKKVATPVLVFDESGFWVTALAGRVRVQMEGMEEVLCPQETAHIPPGTPHTTAPLTRNTHAVLVVTPAVEMNHKRP